jgi:hypothetical protein
MTLLISVLLSSGFLEETQKPYQDGFLKGTMRHPGIGILIVIACGSAKRAPAVVGATVGAGLLEERVDDTSISIRGRLRRSGSAARVRARRAC